MNTFFLVFYLNIILVYIFIQVNSIIIILLTPSYSCTRSIASPYTPRNLLASKGIRPEVGPEVTRAI